MKSLIVFLVLVTVPALAGAPLLNCAIPVGLTSDLKAEMGLKFQFSFDLCFKYYMAKAGCDVRCTNSFTSLCQSFTSGCAATVPAVRTDAPTE